MRIDLHAHSTASDGTDTPAELVAIAAAAGISVLALTDHDTTQGWAEAERARPDELCLIRGAEFSTRVRTSTVTASVHLLGYLFDAAHPAIVAEHTRLQAERRRRGIGIADKMAAAGIPITSDQVLRIAAGAPVGRPHIARALVNVGVVASVDEAFASLLSGRGRFYVAKVDTDLDVAVQMIAAAGGASVLAHPRGRGEYRVLTEERIGGLVELGLTGLELDHPDHSETERAELRRIADAYGLLTTGSSDYHGHNKSLLIGQETTTPAVLAKLIAATSGVTPPLGWSG